MKRRTSEPAPSAAAEPACSVVHVDGDRHGATPAADGQGAASGTVPRGAELKRSEVRRWRMPGGGDPQVIEQALHSRRGQEWAPHWHDEWSIGAVAHGQCRFNLGCHTHEARAGDLLAIAPRTSHTCALGGGDSPSGVLVVMFYLPDTWLRAMGLRPPAQSCRLHAPALAGQAARLGDQAACAAWLRRALAVLELGDGLQGGGELPTAQAQQVLSDFHTLTMQGGALSVADAAERCAVSRKQLHRMVTRWFGMSPGQYQRALRVNQARALLLDGVPVAEVAQAVGFADQAHFTRWFCRVFGYTPGALVDAAVARVDAPPASITAGAS